MADKTARIHLYRGELGRMTAYRIRLDTTSNWALGACVAVVTFALGNPAAPHAVLLLPAALTMVFALLEARRLQDLELIRSRVRLLEQGFFGAQLSGGEAPENWEAQLAKSLSSPVSPLSMWDALSVRLARNYAWLFVALYGAWWLKLWSAGVPTQEAAALGPLPGDVVILLTTIGLAPVGILALLAPRVLPG